MQKLFLLLASSFGALSVAIGAFGAHKFKSLLISNGRLDVFETAVKYQMYHAIALFLLGILMLNSAPHKFFTYAGVSFIIGITIFSGSLYILSLTNIAKWGAVTPFGGVFLIVGWVILFLAILKMQLINV